MLTNQTMFGSVYLVFGRIYIYTTHALSTGIKREWYIAETFQIFLRDTNNYQNDLALTNTAFDRRLSHHYHHQPINVPTAGAQAFHMDYT
jgi:hypothetical protein